MWTARRCEAIKWKAPTFMFGGNLASFYPRSTKHVALMFHTGAALPDHTGLLEGEGDTSRVARFADADDLATTAEALRPCASLDQQQGMPSLGPFRDYWPPGASHTVGGHGVDAAGGAAGEVPRPTSRPSRGGSAERSYVADRRPQG